MQKEEYFKQHQIIKDNCKNYKDFSNTHLKGNVKLQLLCIVRDGEFYLPEFVEYYKNLGVEQFIFLVNNSEDTTVAVLEKYENVKIIINDLPYKTYFHHFKRFLFEEFGKNVWNLVVDIDEFVDYPFSNLTPLLNILEYCDDNNYTAITSQMLDLMPNTKINERRNFLETDIYYSTENEREEYYFDISKCYNLISNANIKFRLNGWRDKKFNVGDILLTKHVAIKGDGKLQLIHDHFVENAHIADFTLLVKHYKFNENFVAYVKKSVIEKNHYNDSVEYVKYDEYLEAGDLNLYEHGMNDISLDINNLTCAQSVISSNLVLYLFDRVGINNLNSEQLNLLFEKLKRNELSNKYYLDVYGK